MKRLLFFIPIFFMLAAVNAQEQEVPAVPEVPSISEDKEEEKVIKVEVVKNSSFESADTYGDKEIKLVVSDIITVPGFHFYYEKIIDSNSSYGVGILAAIDEEGLFGVNRQFAISPFYRIYFLNRQDFGAKGTFVELFSSFARVQNYERGQFLFGRESDETYSRFSIGASIGKKWITRGGYSIETFIGLGSYLDDIDDIGDNPGGHFKLGLAVGRRF
jgi:hypothetical protein